MASKLADILSGKGSTVFTISPEASVLEAALLMNEHQIGGLVVGSVQRVAGIITERDVLRRVVAERRDPAEVRVSEVMTTQLVCGQPEMTVETARKIMRQKRVRHLPIVDDQGRLKGIVSIGDLNAFELDGQELRIHYLHEYIYGRA